MDDDLTELLATGERAAFHGRPVRRRRPAPAGRRARARARPRRRGHRSRLAARRLPRRGGPLRRGACTVLEPLATSWPESAGASAVRGARRGHPRRASSASSAATPRAAELDQRALELAGDAAEAAFDAVLGPRRRRRRARRGHRTPTPRSPRPSRLTDGPQRTGGGSAYGSSGCAPRSPCSASDPDEAVARSTSRRHARRGLRGAPPRGQEPAVPRDRRRSRAATSTRPRTSLRRAATLAESLGSLPLVWPARAVLGALVAPTAPAESAAALASARNVVLQIADDLPGPFAEDWLARPDVAALLAD